MDGLSYIAFCYPGKIDAQSDWEQWDFELEKYEIDGELVLERYNWLLHFVKSFPRNKMYLFFETDILTVSNSK